MLSRAILIVAIVSIVLIPSCGDDSVTGSRPDYSRETVEEVLAALKYAMENRDIGVYEECLSDDYTFEFIPEDCRAAGASEFEPWWDRDEDVAAMDSMFSDAVVTLVNADFFVVGSSLSGQDTTLKVDASIKVTLEPEGSVEPIIYWVFESWLYITFIGDGAHPGLWLVDEIREEAKPSDVLMTAAAEAVSFGRIKAMFRRLDGWELDPRSTPEFLFESFEASMEYRDIADYMACLADAYFFEFTAYDAEMIGLPPDNPWWGKTEDGMSATAMFGSEELVRIECTLGIQDGPWPTENGWAYRLAPDMRFTFEEVGMSEPVIFLVKASWLDVEVVLDPYDPEKWVFAKMEEVFRNDLLSCPDHLLEGGGDTATFGSMKGMFK